MTCGICVVSEILYLGCTVGMGVRGRWVTVYVQVGHGDLDFILCKY